jgi:UDP-N-acetyl-D-glucosamine dehydrogenase
MYKYKGEKFEGIDNLNEAILGNADLVLITTAHSNVDYDFIQKHATAIFDTKNAMKNVLIRDNIELL